MSKIYVQVEKVDRKQYNSYLYYLMKLSLIFEVVLFLYLLKTSTQWLEKLHQELLMVAIKAIYDVLVLVYLY